MTHDEWRRVKDLVSRALLQPEAARQRFLTTHCGTDESLRAEAASLLEAVVHAADFYEQPTLLVAGDRLTGDAMIGLPSFPTEFGQTISPAAEPVVQFRSTSRYVVRREIGAGGMGRVYEAEDRLRDQVVALKTLLHWKPDDIYQLKREFRSLADVAHPNLVSLYDLVVDDDHCFFTMEFVDGVTFVEYVRHGGSTVERAARARAALAQLIAALQALHARGMQHRDIKPSNVLVTPSGRVVLLDFGLTSGVVREEINGRPVEGTPAYLSPEQCLGHQASSAGDWYSVGATLYHALTGRLPFDGGVREILERKTREDPVPVSVLVPRLPAELADICMAMLARDPERRLSGRAALERLLISSSSSADADESSEGVFVGREGPLDVLRTAFADVKRARSVCLVIHGPSGIGKSALVQHFIDREVRNEPVLVFRGRCHEHETIPYKALDGVVDGVTRYLRALPSVELAGLMPAEADALVRLFPVMRVLGVEPRGDREGTDPIVLRRAAFAAFRELLARLAMSCPLIVDIDDLHWADADSAKWLTELLRPPSPSALMLVVSFRSEELEAKPFLRAIIERVDLGERRSIALAPLSDREVSQLVGALSPRRCQQGASPERDIARESGGNPFLVEALTRYLGTDRPASGQATLPEMLAQRLEALPAEARAFLETLAICGRPVLPARIFEACGLSGDDRPLVARLRSARFIKNSRSEDRVEMYHDRIRETLAARVAPDAACRMHDVLASVLVTHGDDDPEALFDHYRAAGRHELAAVHAAAAAHKASGVLAFDLAASFYRHALTLHPHAAECTRWTLGLARALENAGRPVNAAEAYLDVAHHSVGADRIEWLRKAAELLLIGGQIDRGLHVSNVVLKTVGLRLARGPRTAIASLMLRRLQLRWRGLDFAQRDVSEIAPDDLLRIDACWAISAGLAMVDPIRAAAFNIRQLQRALDVGDPSRVARAMALEAGFSVVGIGAGLQRSEVFSRRAEALAAKGGHAYVAALTSLWEGIAAFLTGRWKKASELCGRAATTLSDEYTGVTWELNMSHNFLLGGLVAQGELREVGRHLPGLLQAARERGNSYLELELNTRMILVFLASDDAEGAEQRAQDSIARWSQRGFQRQHYGYALMRVQAALYRGRAREAWALIESCQRPLRRSLFLRVQHTRIESANYRARSALACAAQHTNDARRLRAIAADEAQRILRENRPWGNAFARLLLANVAHQEGDAQAAVEALTAAVDGFNAADMHLYAAVSRRCLGALIGGDQGRSLRMAADRWMAGQEIRDPRAFMRLVAPGLPD